MCSIQDDLDELGHFEQVKESNVTSKSYSTCRKCEEKSFVLLHRKDPTCRSCFEVYCNHKFRSTIGKSKKLKPSDKVLIAYSGGLCSSAMVGLIEQTLKDSANKKLSFIPAVLHVCETFITNSTPEDKHELPTLLKGLTWPVFVTSLEMALRETDDDAFYWENGPSSGSIDCYGNEELKSVLIKSISSTRSLSSKLNYLKLLRTQLITDVARHAGYDFVFYGDSCNDLAVELLCDIAMGRGSQVPSDTGFYDSRYHIPICRPLREFLKRELVFYNQMHNIAYEVPQSLVTKTDSRMSIQRLTETFVCGLQENFPATVHTIFKTGGKVSSVSSDTLQSECCLICKSMLDNKHPDLCSALELLSVSSKISQNKEENRLQCHNHEVKSSCCCEGKESVEGDQFCSSLDRDQNIMMYMCHGCQVTMGEMGLNKNIQPELLKKLKKQINSFEEQSISLDGTKRYGLLLETKKTKMKEEIQEFLLDE